jgi:hypothetical protein
MNAFSHILLKIHYHLLIQYDTTYEVDKVVFYKVRNKFFKQMQHLLSIRDKDKTQ